MLLKKRASSELLFRAWGLGINKPKTTKIVIVMDGGGVLQGCGIV